jgi:hypothetical protein
MHMFTPRDPWRPTHACVLQKGQNTRVLQVARTHPTPLGATPLTSVVSPAVLCSLEEAEWAGGGGAAAPDRFPPGMLHAAHTHTHTYIGVLAVQIRQRFAARSPAVVGGTGGRGVVKSGKIKQARAIRHKNWVHRRTHYGTHAVMGNTGLRARRKRRGGGGLVAWERGVMSRHASERSAVQPGPVQRVSASKPQDRACPRSPMQLPQKQYCASEAEEKGCVGV